MKKIISLIALFVTFTTTAYASGYSGTAAGAGGFVSKSGFVKERTGDENHMDGETAKDDDVDAPPATATNDTKDDVTSKPEKK